MSPEGVSKPPMRSILRSVALVWLLSIVTTNLAHAQITPVHAHVHDAADSVGARIEMPGGVEVVQLPAETDTSRSIPRIYLAWGAPWGELGARDHISPACDDTAAVDTLYLSMDPISTRPQFVGWLATLYFKAAPGDTLRSHWQYTSGGPGRSPVRNEVADARTPMPGASGWPQLQAFGGGHWDHSASSGRLRMVAAVDVLKAPVLLGGRRYTLGRILIRRPPADAEGCGPPMCIELATLQCTFSAHRTGEEPVSNIGQRFVRYQDAEGVACESDAPTKPGGKRRARR